MIKQTSLCGEGATTLGVAWENDDAGSLLSSVEVDNSMPTAGHPSRCSVGVRHRQRGCSYGIVRPVLTVGHSPRRR